MPKSHMLRGTGAGPLGPDRIVLSHPVCFSMGRAVLHQFRADQSSANLAPTASTNRGSPFRCAANRAPSSDLIARACSRST